MRKGKIINNKLRCNNLKVIGGGLLFALSALSVGFASWEVNRQFDANENGFSADGVVDINKYFSFNGSPSVFPYASDGFIYEDVIDPSLINEGYVTIPFQLDVGSGLISDHLPIGTSSLTIRTVLLDKNDNLSLFSVCEVTEARLSVNEHDGIYQYSLSSSGGLTDAEGKCSQWDFLIDDGYLGKTAAYFSVKYALRFTPNSTAEGSSFSFKSDVYDKLDNGSFKFSLKAGVVL